MKKILLISFAIVVLLAILFYSLVLLGVIRDPFAYEEEPYVPKEYVPKELRTTIRVGERTYVEQMQNIAIEGTDDRFIITDKVRFKVPEHDRGETVSFSIWIPYAFHVDGVDYSGIYQVVDFAGYLENDNNPKYKLQILNLTSHYETEVLITEKN